MTKPIVVYYSPIVGAGKEYFSASLFSDTLKPLLHDLKQNKHRDIDSSLSFFSCRGFLGFMKNLYVQYNPFDIDVTVNDLRQVINNGNQDLSHLFISRDEQVSKEHNLNYDVAYFFFCEESLEIEVFSPFLQHSEFVKNAYIVPGTFNIGKWFRPVNPAIQLMSHHSRRVVSPKGDPMMYIRFKTDRPVILKKFYITPELLDISASAVGYKMYEKNKTFEYLYNKFTSSGLKNKVISIIKNNLVE